jgi:hypothetical protein
MTTPAPSMLKDQPVKSLVYKTISVEGYSRAAVQT